MGCAYNYQRVVTGMQEFRGVVILQSDERDMWWVLRTNGVGWCELGGALTLTRQSWVGLQYTRTYNDYQDMLARWYRNSCWWFEDFDSAMAFVQSKGWS